MTANHGPIALGASGSGHHAAAWLSGATAWCPRFHSLEDEMTAINGTQAPDPERDDKLTERPKPARGVWFTVRLGPAWWPTASNLDPTPSEAA